MAWPFVRLHVGHLPRIVLGIEAFDDVQRMQIVEKRNLACMAPTMPAFFFRLNALAAAAAIRTLKRRQHDQTTLMAGAACRF